MGRNDSNKDIEDERRRKALKQTKLMLNDIPPRGKRVLDSAILYEIATHERKDYKQLTKEFLESEKTAEQLLEEQLATGKKSFLSQPEKQDLARYGAKSRAGTKGAIMKREGIRAGQTPPNTRLSASGASSSGLQRDVGPIATVIPKPPSTPNPRPFFIYKTISADNTF